MYSNWTQQALGTIANTMRDLPVDAPLKDRQRALRAAAHNFHGGTSWGKKVWSRECRKYLERHGLPPRTPRSIVESLNRDGVSKQGQKLLAPDIIFPFRP